MIKKIKSIVLATLVAVQMLAVCIDALAVERVYILPSTTCEKAPENNMFQLKGSPDKYILLDNTDEGFFVLAQKFCAIKPFSVNGEAVAFDPEDKNSIAYWLNNDYLESDMLPQIIRENLVERVYNTEGGGSLVPFRKDYSSTCKVVLLSQTEWSKYNAKFGYADDTSSGYWALRSVREMTGSPLVACTSGSNAGLTVDGKWSSALGIRPAFYLSKDFFTKVSVDVANTGDAVMSIIRKGYQPQMDVMYTKEEKYALTESDIAPMADAVTVTGRGIVGEAITGKYSFVSLDEKEEDGTMIQWQKSHDGKVWSTILGAETTSYVPKEEDIGYYVRMRVSPMTDSMAGSSYVSSPLANKIRPVSIPQATNVRIVAGELKPGVILDVKYSFDDSNHDICSETEYIWESSADKASSSKIGDTRYLRLTNNEAGRFIRVGVIPKKKTNSADGRKTIAGELVYSDWAEVENLPVADSVNVIRNTDATISVSKTDDTVSLNGILSSATGDDTLKAEYTVAQSDKYSVVCQWQVAECKDGIYSVALSDSDTLKYPFTEKVWARVKVYTKNSANRGKAVYSEPVYLGTSTAAEPKGEMNLSYQVTAGKKYEIWISNENESNSYAFSFKLKSNSPLAVASDKYLIKTSQINEVENVTGTLVSNVYSNDFNFKACEITPEKNDTLTISDVLTTGIGNVGKTEPVSKARVFIIEK